MIPFILVPVIKVAIAKHIIPILNGKTPAKKDVKDFALKIYSATPPLKLVDEKAFVNFCTENYKSLFSHPGKSVKANKKYSKPRSTVKKSTKK